MRREFWRRILLVLLIGVLTFAAETRGDLLESVLEDLSAQRAKLASAEAELLRLIESTHSSIAYDGTLMVRQWGRPIAMLPDGTPLRYPSEIRGRAAEILTRSERLDQPSEFWIDYSWLRNADGLRLESIPRWVFGSITMLNEDLHGVQAMWYSAEAGSARQDASGIVRFDPASVQQAMPLSFIRPDLWTHTLGEAWPVHTLGKEHSKLPNGIARADVVAVVERQALPGGGARLLEKIVVRGKPSKQREIVFDASNRPIVCRLSFNPGIEHSLLLIEWDDVDGGRIPNLVRTYLVSDQRGGEVGVEQVTWYRRETAAVGEAAKSLPLDFPDVDDEAVYTSAAIGRDGGRAGPGAALSQAWMRVLQLIVMGLVIVGVVAAVAALVRRRA